MASLGLDRNEGETWRQCAERYATPYGMQVEVLEEFDAGIKRGIPPAEAAFYACGEWDVLGYYPND